MASWSFVHTADIHLDPRTTPEKYDQVRQEAAAFIVRLSEKCE